MEDLQIWKMFIKLPACGVESCNLQKLKNELIGKKRIKSEKKIIELFKKLSQVDLGTIIIGFMDYDCPECHKQFVNKILKGDD